MTLTYTVKVQLRLSTVIEVIEEKRDGKACEQLGAGDKKTELGVMMTIGPDDTGNHSRYPHQLHSLFVECFYIDYFTLMRA